MAENTDKSRDDIIELKLEVNKIKDRIAISIAIASVLLISLGLAGWIAFWNLSTTAKTFLEEHALVTRVRSANEESLQIAKGIRNQEKEVTSLVERMREASSLNEIQVMKRCFTTDSNLQRGVETVYIDLTEWRRGLDHPPTGSFAATKTTFVEFKKPFKSVPAVFVLLADFQAKVARQNTPAVYLNPRNVGPASFELNFASTFDENFVVCVNIFAISRLE